jgi:nitrate reductase gamma subunit
VNGALELLTWARGTGLALALAVCVFGILLRLFEIFSLGRKADLAVPRENSPGSGWRTIFSRSLPPPGLLKRAPVTYIGGYVFHIGFAITLFFFVPHIELMRGLFGIGWPGLPTQVVDIAAVAGILGLFAVLASRLTDPVKRFLSGFQDYLAWALTLLPLLTGYLAFHHLFIDYTLMLALHILSVELLLTVLPYTKLFHTVSLFLSRWYNGDIFGRKGVAS